MPDKDLTKPSNELSLILNAFQSAWRSKYRERIHVIPAYPGNTPTYKTPCRISKHFRTGRYYISSRWQGSYPRIAATLQKFKAVKNENLMLGLFDSSLAVINIDCIYDYCSKDCLDLSVPSVRLSVRNELSKIIQTVASNFIIEDSIKGFHLIFWCRHNDFYSTHSRYIVLGNKFLCRYNILTCKPEKTDITSDSVCIRQVMRPSGNYTLLGYDKQIPEYSISFVGNGNGVSRIPKIFRDIPLGVEETYKDISEQAVLKRLDYKEQIKQEIFYEWFLKANHSRTEEIAIDKMINRYNEAVKKNSAVEEDKGFIKDEQGNNIDFIKLTSDTPILKVDAVRRATIESVYKFYAYLNTLPIGVSFTNLSIIDAFIQYCKDNNLEARGLWSHLSGKLLFTNRFYKVLLNLAGKDEDSKLSISPNCFLITDDIKRISKEQTEDLDDEELDEEESPFIQFSDNPEDTPFPFYSNPILEYNYALNASAQTGFRLEGSLYNI